MRIGFKLRPQFFDDDGNMLAGGKLYFYEAGTLTPKLLYEGPAEEMPFYAAPIVLNSRGECSVTFYLKGSYRIILKTSDDETIWDVDNVVDLMIASTEQRSVTIGGVKTFSVLPVLPAAAPTSVNEMVNQAYVSSAMGGDISATITTHDNAATAHAASTNLEKIANKGIANGYASLGAGGYIPTAQLASGSAGSTTFLAGNSTWKVADWTLLTDEVYMTEKVEISTPGIFYDGPSLTLSAGVWFISASLVLGGCLVASNRDHRFIGKLWNGTTVYASSSKWCSPDNDFGSFSMPLITIQQFTSETTVKLSATMANHAEWGFREIYDQPFFYNTGCADTGSYINALRLSA